MNKKNKKNKKTKVNTHYLTKYALPKKPYQTPNVEAIKRIAKQILVALHYLHTKGLAYGHLHTGNVLIEPAGCRVRLTDLVNGLLGLPYYYRTYVVEHHKLKVSVACCRRRRIQL